MMPQSLDERVQTTAGFRFALQAIITKADTIPDRDLASSIAQMKKDVAEAAPTHLDPIVARQKSTFISASMPFGILSCELVSGGMHYPRSRVLQKLKTALLTVYYVRLEGVLIH